jgi:hypothetical protein
MLIHKKILSPKNAHFKHLFEIISYAYHTKMSRLLTKSSYYRIGDTMYSVSVPAAAPGIAFPAGPVPT